MYVCASLVCMSPQRSEESVSSPATGVLGVNEPATLSALPFELGRALFCPFKNNSSGLGSGELCSINSHPWI